MVRAGSLNDFRTRVRQNPATRVLLLGAVEALDEAAGNFCELRPERGRLRARRGAEPADDANLPVRFRLEPHQRDERDPLTIGLRELVVDDRQHIRPERIADQRDLLGPPFGAVVVEDRFQIDGGLIGRLRPQK